MKRLLPLFLIALLAVVLPFATLDTASAQGAVYITPAAAAGATDIVSGRVVSTVSVDLDGDAHRVSEVEITNTQKGELTGSVLVEVPGGERADGTIVHVSHTPELVPGALVQLALEPTPGPLGVGLGMATNPDLDVYSVVNGIDGASGLTFDDGGGALGVGDYSLTGSSWPDFAPPVAFKVNPANSGVSSSDTIAGVQQAFQLWEDDPGSDIYFTYGGTTTKVGINLNDNQNTVSWVSSSASWLAQASWVATGGGDILGFDVQVNRSYSWAHGALNGHYDIGTVVAHEVGHGIGFSHVGPSSELMYFQITSGTTKGLGAGDRSGAAYLYPAVSKDPDRIVAAAAIIDGLESYANANGDYVVTGGGWQGTGQGWFKAFPSGYQSSIRNVLSFKGHFPGGAPADPNDRDFLIYRCQDRIGVFADTDTATSVASSASWWSSNGCTQYPEGQGYSHLTLSAAVTNDPARVAAAADIVAGLESYANANGDYVVTGGGWQGTGQGWFKAFPSGYQSSIRNVLSFKGHFPGGAPADPNDRDFLIYRCQDRIGVFADTDTATSVASSASWWSSNGCTQYPLNNGYTHLTLAAPLPSQDPARVAAAADIVDGFEALGNATSSYVVSGGGHGGGGQGEFDSVKPSYPDSIANVMSNQGYFPGGVPVDPNDREFLIYRCNDRVGVFSDTDSTVSAAWASNWWTSNGCTQYPINNGYTHLTLAAPLPSQDPARVAAAADIVDGFEALGNATSSYVVSGGGHGGGGQGEFDSVKPSYPDSIANVMSNQGYFPGGVPVDPNDREFLIYRCNDRVGVFSDTDSTVSAAWASNWWTSNGCTQYPINNGYTHLTLAAPLP